MAITLDGKASLLVCTGLTHDLAVVAADADGAGAARRRPGQATGGGVAPLPEMNLVRKGLKETGMDPVVALAVLMKTLADNHLATAQIAHAAEPREITVFEAAV